MNQILSTRCPRCGVQLTQQLSDLKISPYLGRMVLSKMLAAHIADYHAGRKPKPARRGLLRLLRGNQ